MKTKREIIQETSEFYNSLNRGHSEESCWGHSEESCVYLTDDGRMCAVGRCLVNPQIFMHDGIEGVTDGMTHEYLESHLKEEHRGHPMAFWADLQFFHDDNRNWDKKGMTEDGVEQYNTLLTTYTT